jgi:hypothetical protein
MLNASKLGDLQTGCSLMERSETSSSGRCAGASVNCSVGTRVWLVLCRSSDGVSFARPARCTPLPYHLTPCAISPHARWTLHGVGQVASSDAQSLRSSSNCRRSVVGACRYRYSDSPRSPTLHGAPEELVDTATSSASTSMRPRFSSQCEHPCAPSFRFQRCACVVCCHQPRVHASLHSSYLRRVFEAASHVERASRRHV